MEKKKKMSHSEFDDEFEGLFNDDEEDDPVEEEQPVEDEELDDENWWKLRTGSKQWDDEELRRIAWDGDDNPWKKEAQRIRDEKRYLENEVMRLQNKVMLLNGELNRLKTPPQIVGTVVEILKGDQLIASTSGGPSFVVRVSSTINRNELKVGTKVSLNKDSMSVTGILPSSKDPLVGAAELEEKPDISFKEIGGLKSQIIELKEVVELPLLQPRLFIEVGIDPPKGVLLIGPPGCGKTLLAKAIAHETDATFLRMVGSELVQKYIGEGSRLVRELFKMAKEKAPTILFLDEIDAIAGRRTDSSTSADREVQRTLIQLLAELDGFDPLGDVRIIAATNRPDILDPAILRPGRIDRIIDIPLPDIESRVEIFRVHTSRMNLSKDVNLKDLAAMTDGFNGSQIKAICTEGGMFAIRNGRKKVLLKDIREAVHKIEQSKNQTEMLQLGDTGSGKQGYSMFA